MSQDVTHPSPLSTSEGVHYFSFCLNGLQYIIHLIHYSIHLFCVLSWREHSVKALKEKLHAFFLSLRFNGHFPGEPWLASTRMSPFWFLLELRVMEMVVVKTGAMSPPTNQHPVFYVGRMPFLSPNQQCQSNEGIKATCLLVVLTYLLTYLLT